MKRGVFLLVLHILALAGAIPTGILLAKVLGEHSIATKLRFFLQLSSPTVLVLSLLLSLLVGAYAGRLVWCTTHMGKRTLVRASPTTTLLLSLSLQLAQLTSLLPITSVL